MSLTDTQAYGIFALVVIVLLALDLGVFHKTAHEIKLKEAIGWSIFWIAIALTFNAFVFIWKGSEAAMQFFTGYVLEKSLSIDNLFVFVMVFSYFRVSGKYQHRVLFWGILGAVIMRGIFIFAGIAIIKKFEWTMYIFGLILIYSGFKMAFQKDKEIHPEKNPVLKMFRKIMPVTNDYVTGRFVVTQDGRRFATPLLVVLLVVETTDVIFAVDSIPAILGISRDPFIVYTSNVFAILGLRALYFALAGIIKMFRFLGIGLAIILCFIGVKMLLGVEHYDYLPHYEIPIPVALGVVAGILTISILLSILVREKGKSDLEKTLESHAETRKVEQDSRTPPANPT